MSLHLKGLTTVACFLLGFRCIESVDFTFATAAAAATVAAIALPEQGAFCFI